MTKCTSKHMIYLVAWFVCMGFILLSNFSWIALGILLLLTGFSVYKKVFDANENNIEYITLNIRYYIIISTMFIESIFIINYWKGFVIADFWENVGKRFQYAFELISAYYEKKLFWVIASIVVTVFFLIIKDKFIKHRFIHTVLDYLFPVCIYSLLFTALIGNSDLRIAYYLYALVFIMGDLVRKVYDEEKILGTKAGKRSFGILSFVLLICAVVNSKIRFMLYTFSLSKLEDLIGSWSVFLVLFAVALVVFISIAMIHRQASKGYAYEKIVLLITACILPVIFVSVKVNIAYSWIILIGYLIYVLVFATKIGPRAFDDKYKYSVNDYLPIVLISIFTVCLMIGANFGKLLIYAVLMLSTWLLVSVYRRNMSVEDQGKQLANGVTAAIIWLFVNTLSRLWMFHQHYISFIILSIITGIFVAVIYIINHNPGIYQDNMLSVAGQLLLPVLYLFVALAIFSHGGSNIDLVVDDDYIVISVEADGKTNSIAEAKYCWLEDMPDVIKDITDEDKTEYFEFESGCSIPLKKGMLKIIVEDEHGVRTVKKCWYGDK